MTSDEKNYMYLEGRKIETHLTVEKRIELFRKMSDDAQIKFAATNPVEVAFLLRSA